MINTTINKDGTTVVEYGGKTYTQSEWEAYFAANPEEFKQLESEVESLAALQTQLEAIWAKIKTRLV